MHPVSAPHGFAVLRTNLGFVGDPKYKEMVVRTGLSRDDAELMCFQYRYELVYRIIQ